MSNILNFLFGSTLLVAAHGACPSGWIAKFGSCYKFQSEKQNWVDALVMCRFHKGDLIAIETADEQKWFQKVARTFNYTERDDGFWLGATDWQVEGSWSWESTKLSVNYTVWANAQPNNRNNAEHCLAAVHMFDYNWSDDPCNWNRLGYVCEMKEPSVAPIVG